MPKRSTVESQSALSLIAEVERPRMATSPASGRIVPGREVDEHFGGRPIEPEDGDVLARGDPQLRRS